MTNHRITESHKFDITIPLSYEKVYPCVFQNVNLYLMVVLV